MKAITPKVEQWETEQSFWQQPDCYDGKSCNQHRPRWMTSYPKEGICEDGEVLKLEIDARTMPPGTRVTIEIPCCPCCGERADAQCATMKPDKRGGWKHIRRRTWPRCGCGFSWKKWVEDNYS